MAKKFKPLPLTEIYPHVEFLSTTSQQTLLGFIEKILEDKKDKARKELELLENGNDKK